MSLLLGFDKLCRDDQSWHNCCGVWSTAWPSPALIYSELIEPGPGPAGSRPARVEAGNNFCGTYFLVAERSTNIYSVISISKQKLPYVRIMGRW